MELGGGVGTVGGDVRGIMNRYSPVLVGAMYIAKIGRYFPAYAKVSNFDPADFVDLGRYLEREKIDYQAYFDFVLGVLDRGQRPLSPKSLADPVLVQKFRAMSL